MLPEIDTTTHVYKMEPIELVNPVKQSLFDYIITYVRDAAASLYDMGNSTPMLVRGDYDTLYKKLINNELILGCRVVVTCRDGIPMKQMVSAINDTPIGIYIRSKDSGGFTIPTISDKPVLDLNEILIDCNNNHYNPQDGLHYIADASNIPFDESGVK